MESAVNTNTTPPTKRYHRGGAVCPYYGVVSVDVPNPTRVTSSEGIGRGQLRWV